MPEKGIIKVICDGSCDEHSRDYGIGVLVRGADGQIVDGLNRHIKWEGSEGIEALTMLEGDKLAKQWEWQRIKVETDSLNVVYQLLGSTKHKIWRAEMWTKHKIESCEQIRELDIHIR